MRLSSPVLPMACTAQRLGSMRISVAILALLLVFTTPHRAFAHAALQSSTPAAGATVAAGVLPVLLKYNSRVDAAHSSLALVQDGKPQPLAIDKHADANVLRSQTAPLQAGHYLLRWQAVASDGHISRGQIPFEVK